MPRHRPSPRCRLPRRTHRRRPVTQASRSSLVRPHFTLTCKIFLHFYLYFVYAPNSCQLQLHCYLTPLSCAVQVEDTSFTQLIEQVTPVKPDPAATAEMLLTYRSICGAEELLSAILKVTISFLVLSFLELLTLLFTAFQECLRTRYPSHPVELYHLHLYLEGIFFHSTVFIRT